jgi:hypothetical protein
LLRAPAPLSPALQVRLKVLESLAKIVEAVGPDKLETEVLPALQKLGTDALWRVREKVIEQMPLFAKNLVRSPSRPRQRSAAPGSAPHA